MPRKPLLRKAKRNTGGEYPYDPLMNMGQGSPYGMDNPMGAYNPNAMSPEMMQQRGQPQQTQLINAVDNKPIKSWGKWALHMLEEIPNTLDTIVKMNSDSISSFIEKNPKIKRLKEVPVAVPGQPGMYHGMTPWMSGMSGVGYDNYPYNTGMYPPTNPGMMYGGEIEKVKSADVPTKTILDEKPGTPLNESGWLYAMIYGMISFTLFIAPFIILGLSLYYSRSIWYSYWFREQNHLEDFEGFDEARSLYRLAGSYYIHDYILYIIIILLFFVISSIFLALSIYVKNYNPKYNILKMRTFIAIGICIFMIICYLAIDTKNKTIQTIGIRRDELINNIYENINYDYINYLNNIGIENNKSCNNLLSASTASSEQKCSPGIRIDIVSVNSNANLLQYIKNLIKENSLDGIKNTPKPDNVVNMSPKDTVFTLVTKAIITNKIISGLQEYSKNKFFDKNSFNDIMSIIASINIYSYSIFGDDIFTSLKCQDLLINLNKNDALFSKEICEECEKISSLIDDSVTNFREAINVSFPHRLGLSVFISIIIIVFYIALFVSDAYAARKQIYQGISQGMSQMNSFRQPGSMTP